MSRIKEIAEFLSAEQGTNLRPVQVGLTEYLNSLKRVNRALAEMGTTNMRANQQAIGDFNELLAQGSTSLEEVYRSLLLENSQPLEPLHYLTRGKTNYIPCHHLEC